MNQGHPRSSATSGRGTPAPVPAFEVLAAEAERSKILIRLPRAEVEEQMTCKICLTPNLLRGFRGLETLLQKQANVGAISYQINNKGLILEVFLPQRHCPRNENSTLIRNPTLNEKKVVIRSHFRQFSFLFLLSKVLMHSDTR